MPSLKTNNIKIIAESRYQPLHSDPVRQNFLFSYNITVQNCGEAPVKLLSRIWFVTDSLAGTKEVEGKGVVGQCPTILPGKQFNYQSWCPLISEIGRMEGIFTMQSMLTLDRFEVVIPPFDLQADIKLS